MRTQSVTFTMLQVVTVLVKLRFYPESLLFDHKNVALPSWLPLPAWRSLLHLRFWIRFLLVSSRSKWHEGSRSRPPQWRRSCRSPRWRAEAKSTEILISDLVNETSSCDYYKAWLSLKINRQEAHIVQIIHDSHFSRFVSKRTSSICKKMV